VSEGTLSTLLSSYASPTHLNTQSTPQASIIITPIFVKILLSGMTVSLDALDLLIKMSASILLPLVVGFALRMFIAPVQAFVDKHRVIIYMFTNFQMSKLNSRQSDEVSWVAGAWTLCDVMVRNSMPLTPNLCIPFLPPTLFLPARRSCLRT
jgi:hypothetical protein